MWLTESATRLLERARPGVLSADLNACNEYCDGLGRATAVQCPTLLRAGRRDLMTPLRTAGDLAAAIDESQTVILDDRGRMLMAEKPNKVLDQRIRFSSGSTLRR